MIKTGSLDLDEFLNGGYKKGGITQIYGESATGKTTLALIVALNQAKLGKKVFFIDTERGFNLQRIKQIDNEANIKNIYVNNVENFNDQCKIVNNIVSLAEKGVVDLIVIDSLGMYYRLEKKDDANTKLASQLRELAWAAREKNIPIVITNQVYEHFEDGIKPVGGEMVKNWSKCLIKLEKSGKRKICLEKPNKKEMFFEIYDKGIRKI